MHLSATLCFFRSAGCFRGADDHLERAATDRREWASNVPRDRANDHKLRHPIFGLGMRLRALDLFIGSPSEYLSEEH